MSTDDQARELLRHFPLADLPMGVLLLAADGRILEGNACARQSLGLPDGAPLPATIDSLFYDGQARAALWQQMAGQPPPGSPTRSLILHLYHGTHDAFVRWSSQPLLDPHSSEIVGYLSCFVDVTAEERHRQLSDHFPVGIYRLDEEDRIVYANAALATILGFSDPTEVEDRPVGDFYAYPNDAAAFRETVIEQGFVVSQVRNLVKKSGEFFFASISSVAIKGPDGRYRGREGTLVDVTQEERYKRSLNDVPVGFYEVRIEDGVDIIRQCNPEFATMFDSSEEDLIGSPIRELYANALDFPIFRRAIEANDHEGLPLLGYRLRVKSRLEREMVIEVNSRLLKDREGRTVGRTGVIRDVSPTQRLEDEMRTLQADIGRMLHAYTSTLVMARQGITPAILALGPSPFDPLREPTTGEEESALSAPVARMQLSMGKLIDLARQPDWAARKIPAPTWEEWLRLADLFQTYVQTIPTPELRLPAFRRTARRIIDLTNTALRGKLPQEQLRQVVRNAVEIERIACLAELRHVECETVAMDTMVRSLRDMVTSGTRPEEPVIVLAMWDVVTQAMRHLEDFAATKGVTIRTRDDLRGAQVRASQRSVLRALSNLLHNAVKYSWHREKGTPPWIAVRGHLDGRFVIVEFENYGVPIPKDEIEHGLIFQLGYRGRLSSDRGRLGTGIGLTDARDSARMYGGDVSVESRPASPDAGLEDYTVPYLTTVRFWLPRHAGSGRS